VIQICNGGKSFSCETRIAHDVVRFVSCAASSRLLIVVLSFHLEDRTESVFYSKNLVALLMVREHRTSPLFCFGRSTFFICSSLILFADCVTEDTLAVRGGTYKCVQITSGWAHLFSVFHCVAHQFGNIFYRLENCSRFWRLNFSSVKIAVSAGYHSIFRRSRSRFCQWNWANE